MKWALQLVLAILLASPALAGEQREVKLEGRSYCVPEANYRQTDVPWLPSDLISEGFQFGFPVGTVPDIVASRDVRGVPLELLGVVMPLPRDATEERARSVAYERWLDPSSFSETHHGSGLTYLYTSSNRRTWYVWRLPVSGQKGRASLIASGEFIATCRSRPKSHGDARRSSATCQRSVYLDGLHIDYVTDIANIQSADKYRSIDKFIGEAIRSWRCN